MSVKGFPKAMVIAFSIIVAILIAEAIYVFANGTEKNAAPAEEQAVAGLLVNGTKLTAGGQVVTFKGISFGWHNLWPRFYNSECVKNLQKYTGTRIFRASIGADTLGEFLNGTNHHPGYIEEPETALKCLYAVIDGAIEAGSYVLVDWHSHLIHQEAANEFFTKVATRYADCPYVVYELFNEPVCPSFEENGSYADLGNPEKMKAYWQQLKAYSEELIGIITSISTVHPLILVGCPSWDQRIDLPAEEPITCYDNLMYTVHFYAGTHKQSLRDACDAAIAKGIPVFISECAACDASGDGAIDMESWNEWNSWAAANNISMLIWSVGDKNETCSIFTPEASSEGPWTEDVVKPWGRICYDWLQN